MSTTIALLALFLPVQDDEDLAKQVKQLVRQLDDENLDEREKAAEKLTKLGVASTVFAPCSNAPAEGDWLRVMEQNIQNLERVFRE